MNVLAFLLGTLHANVTTILAESANPVNLTSFEFKYELGELLAKANIQ